MMDDIPPELELAIFKQHYEVNMLWDETEAFAKAMIGRGCKAAHVADIMLEHSLYVSNWGSLADQYRHRDRCEKLGRRMRQTFENRYAGELDLKSLLLLKKIETLPRNLQ